MFGAVIIEQSPATTRDLAGACAAAGIPVLGVARDGLDGVRLVQELRPTHVTIDLVLPRLPGLQVIEALRRLELDPIVLVVSAVSAREPVVAARAAGARAYLLKPIALPKLIEIMTALAPANPSAARAAHS